VQLGSNEIHFFHGLAPRRKLLEQVVVELGVRHLQDLEVPWGEGRVLQRREFGALPDQVNDAALALDRDADRRPGVVLVAVAEEAAREADQVFGLVVAVAAEAEVDAGRGRPEVAPPPREHAGAHRLPRLERQHDAVQERVRERAEAIGLGAPIIVAGAAVAERGAFRRAGGRRFSPPNATRIEDTSIEIVTRYFGVLCFGSSKYGGSVSNKLLKHHSIAAARW
jgi:hypothetical protein